MNRGAGRRVEDCLLTLWSERGPGSTLLLPLAWLHGAIAALRRHTQARHAWRAPVPVIVIGNILVGGTGKTPVAQAVCSALTAAGLHVGLVSRGYGVRIGAQPRLSDDSPRAAYLGDEPALLHTATGVPVAAHPQRARAAQALLAAHPEVDVLVADDGLQHLALARDVEIIVQDARLTGNGRLLPAGPLREPASRLARVDWLITHLAPGDPAPASLPRGPRHVTMRLHPVRVRHLASGRLLPWGEWLAIHGSVPCNALAGIGQPARFFTMLEAAGATLTRALPLPDHGVIPPELLDGLPDAPVLITAKDAVKCANAPDTRLWEVQAEPTFSNPGWLTTLAGRVQRPLRSAAHNAGASIKL